MKKIFLSTVFSLLSLGSAFAFSPVFEGPGGFKPFDPRDPGGNGRGPFFQNNQQPQRLPQQNFPNQPNLNRHHQAPPIIILPQERVIIPFGNGTFESNRGFVAPQQNFFPQQNQWGSRPFDISRFPHIVPPPNFRNFITPPSNYDGGVISWAQGSHMPGTHLDFDAQLPARLCWIAAPAPPPSNDGFNGSLELPDGRRWLVGADLAPNQYVWGWMCSSWRWLSLQNM